MSSVTAQSPVHWWSQYIMKIILWSEIMGFLCNM